MIPNVLHNSARTERMPILENELRTQGIETYLSWDIIHAKTVIESINISHKQIIKWAKQEGLEKVLVFEDDIRFCGNGAFDYYLKNEPDDYDLWLGGIYLGVIENGISKEFTALHCMMVHSRFYDSFLDTPNNMHLDHALANKGLYKVCEPFIAIQHNGYSDNSGVYCNYDIMFKDRKLFNRDI